MLTKLKRSAVNDDLNKIEDNYNIDPAETSQDTCDDLSINTSKNEQKDDCLIYGMVLTKKLRTYSVYERNLIMYKIDGLLIENPPGFETSNTEATASIPKHTCMKTSKSLEHSNAEKCPSMGKKVKRYSTSDIDTSPLIEDSYTIASQDTSTHQQTTVSPLNANHVSIPLVKAMSSIQNQPVKETSHILNLVNFQSSKQNPVKVTSIVPNQSAKISVLKLPIKAICQQSALAASVPSHLPLKITIPENILTTSSKFVPSSYSKGKIVIIKSKSSKYIASSQPPILITVPSVSKVVPLSTQCSTAAHSTQKYDRIDSELNETDLKCSFA